MGDREMADKFNEYFSLVFTDENLPTVHYNLFISWPTCVSYLSTQWLEWVNVPSLTPLNRDQAWSQFTLWTPAAMLPHSDNNNTMKHKATFCDHLKHNTKKNALKSVTATVQYHSNKWIKSNKRKTLNDGYNDTAVSVITHATYAIVLRKNLTQRT